MNENLNKEHALQFLKLISSGEVDRAYDQFTSPTGKHHSPYFAAGFEALKSGMKENYRQFPQKQSEVKHAISRDDIVAVHSHVILEPGEPGFAALLLFRFEDGKIVEIWDFIQPIPVESPNSDGPF